MGEQEPISKFKQQFIWRTKWARVSRGLTQETVAELLDIDQDRYKNYETKRCLPHELLHRFCIGCGINEAWLFTGKGMAPSMGEAEVKAQISKEIRGRKKRAA